MYRQLFAVSLLLLTTASSQAQGNVYSLEIARLVATARLWGAVKYFHPYLAERPGIDWDEAVVDVIPRIEAANSRAEYAAAVQRMLDVLGDPATHVLNAEAPLRNTVTGPAFETSLRDGIALLTFKNPGGLGDFNALEAVSQTFANSTAKARGIVLDLRAPSALSGDDRGNLDGLFDAAHVAQFVAGTVSEPSIRRRMYVGFVPQERSTSGNYYASFETQLGNSAQGQAKRSLPISIIVNPNSYVPPTLRLLQAKGTERIVSVGGAPGDTAPETFSIPLSDGLTAVVRDSDYIGLPPIQTIVMQSGATPHDVLAAAVDALNRAPAASATAAPALETALPAFAPDSAYETMAVPSEPYRLLAAFRIFNVIRYFYPYRDLLHEDWDAVLRNAIPGLQAASTARTYLLAVAKMYSHLHDTHGFIEGPIVKQYFGAWPPVYVRCLHGVPVITDLIRPVEARSAGAEIGDVILSVDGKPVPAVISYWKRYIRASTPQSMCKRIFWSRGLDALTGETGSTLTLRVRTPHGARKEFSLIRGTVGGDPTRGGDVVRVLSGNVGYVDLDRLTVDQVAGMFQKLRNTRAIVFDMRGYPNGTAWPIAPRLTLRTNVRAALFDTPLVRMMSNDQGDGHYLPAMQEFYQMLPAAAGSRYLKPTVMLINEVTLSQAEHTGLFFRAANGTTFVGTPSAGANGDVTNFFVPGGIKLSFTGQGVRHVDGSGLQRVGLKPDVLVEPTAAQIAIGDDVVLQAGLKNALQRSRAGAAEVNAVVTAERASELRAFQMAH